MGCILIKIICSISWKIGVCLSVCIIKIWRFYLLYQTKLLFKAYCKSFYTGNMWVHHTKMFLDALQVQYNNIFRLMLRLPRYCSGSAMFVLNHTYGFHAIMRKKTASLIRRVRVSWNTIPLTVAVSYDSTIIKYLVRNVNPNYNFSVFLSLFLLTCQQIYGSCLKINNFYFIVFKTNSKYNIFSEILFF